MMVIVVWVALGVKLFWAVRVRLESRLVSEWVVGWADGGGGGGPSLEQRTENGHGIVDPKLSVVIIRCQSPSMHFGGWFLLQRRIPGGYLKCRLLV
jgi:hypothetical protein